MLQRVVILSLCLMGFFVDSMNVYAKMETVKIYSSLGDGYLITAPYPASWNTQYYSITGRSADSTSQVLRVMSGSYYTPGGYLGIMRSLLPFDTSLIPDNAKIISADLNLFYFNKIDDYNDEQGYISLLQGFQHSSSEVINEDVALCGDLITNPTKGADDIDISNIELGKYSAFNLNVVALSWINTSGYTKFCVREGHDLENVEVVQDHVDGMWHESMVNFNSANAVNPNVRPYLEITYEISDNQVSGEYPLYTQITSPYPSEVETASWSGDTYASGGYRCGSKIAGCGCMITSLVMLARSHGVTEGVDGSEVNPGNFNQWLKSHGGYDDNGNLFVGQGLKYFGVIEDGQEKSHFSFNEDALSSVEVKERVAGGQATVSEMVASNNNGTVVPKHFVLITSKLLTGDYSVNDPLWYNTKTLDDVKTLGYQQDYNNTITSGRDIGYSATPVALTGSVEMSLLGVDGSGVEAAVVDETGIMTSQEIGSVQEYVTPTANLLFETPDGRKVGQDAAGDSFDFEHAQYSESFPIGASYNPTSGETLDITKQLGASRLAGGVYHVYVAGTESGTYKLEGFVHDISGQSHHFSFTAATAAGLADVYEFNLETGEVVLLPVEGGALDEVIDRDVEDPILNRFFKMWVEKIFAEIAEGKNDQAIQHIETFKTLMEAKKVESVALDIILENLIKKIK